MPPNSCLPLIWGFQVLHSSSANSNPVARASDSSSARNSSSVKNRSFMTSFWSNRIWADSSSAGTRVQKETLNTTTTVCIYTELTALKKGLNHLAKPGLNHLAKPSLRGRRRLNQIDEKFCKFLTIGQACLQRFPASARSDWSRGWAVQELHLILHVTVSFPPKAGSSAMRNRALACRAPTHQRP